MLPCKVLSEALIPQSPLLYNLDSFRHVSLISLPSPTFSRVPEGLGSY